MSTNDDTNGTGKKESPRSESPLNPSEGVGEEYWGSVCRELEMTVSECKAIYDHYKMARNKKRDAILNFNPHKGIFPRFCPNSLIRLVIRGETRNEFFRFHPAIYRTDMVKPRELALMKLIHPEGAQEYLDSSNGYGIRKPRNFDNMDVGERATLERYAWNYPDTAANYIRGVERGERRSSEERGRSAKRRSPDTHPDSSGSGDSLGGAKKRREGGSGLLDTSKSEMVDNDEGVGGVKPRDPRDKEKIMMTKIKIEKSEPEDKGPPGEAMVNFYKNKSSEATRKIEVLKRKHQCEEIVLKNRFQIDILKADKKMMEEREIQTRMRIEKDEAMKELNALKQTLKESEEKCERKTKLCEDLEEKLESSQIREGMLQEELDRKKKELVESRKVSNQSERIKKSLDAVRFSEQKIQNIEKRCKVLEAELEEKKACLGSQIAKATPAEVLQHVQEKKRLTERKEALEREQKKTQAELSMKKSELASLKEEKTFMENSFNSLKSQLKDILARF